MGEVAAKLKIMPEGTDVDLERVRKDIENIIPEGVRIHAVVEEPVAFGLKALMVAVIMAENITGTDALEAAIAKIEGIQSVEVAELGLL